jgi:hypothetical protein
MRSIGKQGRSGAALTRALYHCPVGSFCHTAVNGRLFRCPFAAHATTLGAIPDRRDGSVDLSPADDPSRLPELRRRIARYLSSQKILEACDYCPYGLPAADAPAAEQAPEPLAYTRCS